MLRTTCSEDGRIKPWGARNGDGDSEGPHRFRKRSNTRFTRAEDSYSEHRTRRAEQHCSTGKTALDPGSRLRAHCSCLTQRTQQNWSENKHQTTQLEKQSKRIVLKEYSIQKSRVSSRQTLPLYILFGALLDDRRVSPFLPWKDVNESSTYKKEQRPTSIL